MTLEQFKDSLTALMQSRIGWAKAEAYARDVTEYMRRQGLEVHKREEARVSLFKPGVLAEIDQGLAEARRDIDITIKEIREWVDDSDEEQALANLALAMTMLDQPQKDIMLLAALWRLAKEAPNDDG